MNIISRDLWEMIWEDEDAFVYDVKMGKVKQISAFGGSRLNVHGTFKAWIEVKGKQRCFEEFVIVNDVSVSLLSFNTSRRLRVIKIGADVNAITNDVKQFPKVPGVTVKFSIDRTIRPIKNSALRIPASLEAEVEQQLQNLENQGIIECARHDAPWMSRMDVVVKDRSKWRIVIDMRAANKAIRRELYPFPTMERFVTKLSSA